MIGYTWIANILVALSLIKSGFVNFDIISIGYVLFVIWKCKIMKRADGLAAGIYCAIYLLFRDPSVDNYGYLLRLLSLYVTPYFTCWLVTEVGSKGKEATENGCITLLVGVLAVELAAMALYNINGVRFMGFPFYTRNMMDRHVFGPAMGFTTCALVVGYLKIGSHGRGIIRVLFSAALFISILCGVLSGSRSFISIVAVVLAVYVTLGFSPVIRLPIKKNLVVISGGVVALSLYVRSVFDNEAWGRSFRVLNIVSGGDASRSNILESSTITERLGVLDHIGYIVGIQNPGELTHMDHGIVFVMIAYGITGLCLLAYGLAGSCKYAQNELSRLGVRSRDVQKAYIAWLTGLAALTVLGGEVLLIPRFFMMYGISLSITLISLLLGSSKRRDRIYGLV